MAAQPTPVTCNTLALVLSEVRHDRDRALALWKRPLELQPGQKNVEGLKRGGGL